MCVWQPSRTHCLPLYLPLHALPGPPVPFINVTATLTMTLAIYAADQVIDALQEAENGV